MNLQENDKQTVFEDLPVTDAQADETKGGTSTNPPIGRYQAMLDQMN